MTEVRELAAAYVDGELSGAELAAFERTMLADPAVRAQVEAERALRERLARHYAPVMDEPVPDRLSAMFAGAGEAQIIDFASEKAKRRQTSPRWMNFGAIAATLAVGVITGQMVDLSGGPVSSRDGQLIAKAGLERALDVQLASAQPTDAKVRIGVSFRDSTGAICRSFDSTDLAGIACRTGEDWQLRQTVAPDRKASTEYRQAGSSNAAIMQAAQSMMAGEPLDAAAERKAREAGWR
jgi:hypothetical protein